VLVAGCTGNQRQPATSASCCLRPTTTWNGTCGRIVPA